MQKNKTIAYVDLFCGIGGFRIGAEKVFGEYGIKAKCVFSSDIDKHAQKAYYENFGEMPFGDISLIDERFIPDHDILFAGFPCQPFSIIGHQKGFEDTRGTLFFDIARIVKAKRPALFVLENVKQLFSHDKGHTYKRIKETLQSLGYTVNSKILNALDYGLPQKRERLIIVGTLDKAVEFEWPAKDTNYTPLSQLLENDVPPQFYASKEIIKKRKARHKSKYSPSIWHENISGNISSYPYSCALRAGASYNYLLVNGERRLTPRELLRLQGFPDTYKIVVTDSQVRKQAGNAVPVNMVQAVLKSVVKSVFIDNIKIAKLKHSYRIHGQPTETKNKKC